MPSRDEPNRDLESPFLDRELFVREVEAEREPRATALAAESPFLNAFEKDSTNFSAPEEFIEAKENHFAWERDEFPENESEAYDEATQSDLEDSLEEFYDDKYADTEAEDEEDSYPEDALTQEEVAIIPEEVPIELDEEVAYPPEEFEYEEEPSPDEEFFSGLLRLLNPGAIVQRVQQLLGEGVFNLSLLGRFASGQIWNEDDLALEILFYRQLGLRPTELETVSGSKRLRLLRSLAVKHQRELKPIRERIVRPIFGNPANFHVGSASECQIRDLREEVRKLGPLPGGKNSRGEIWYKRDARRSPRKQAAVDSIVLHHMAYNIGNDVNSYKKVGAHYIVTADGQIAQLYDDLDFLNASNGFNARCVSIEFAGNFPELRYHWWKNRTSLIPDRCYLTPAQIRAGRCLLATLKARLPGIKYLYSHRQSSKTRANDPGPDVWFNIGEWALANLNLTDRLPHTHIGKGQPIPEMWRNARAVVAKKEMVSDEFSEPFFGDRFVVEERIDSSVVDVSLMHDDFQNPIREEEIIGLDGGENLNIRLTTSANGSAARGSIPIKVVVRTPGKPKKVIITRALKVPQIGADPHDSSKALFQLSVPLTNIGKILTPLDDVQEVATVRRIGGTSDVHLLRALSANWQLRGQAEQASKCGVSSSSFSDERPDALKLFQAGGVAIVELKDLSNTVRIKRFVRNPADIFYYTGHGIGLGFSRKVGAVPSMNCLAIDDHASAYGYCCWASPGDLVPYWKSPMDLDVLIIAGCSVLAVDASKDPVSGDGLEWAKLVQVKGGPLEALLGYGDWDDNEHGGPTGATAPLDKTAGNAIASEMGKWIKDHPKLNGIIQQWLIINMSHQNPFGVGIDKDGVYWRTRRKKTPGWKVWKTLKTRHRILYVIETKTVV